MQGLSESWIPLIRKQHREVFSELDVLLRSLDRFFNVENLPFSREDIAGRNFFDELSAVRDTIMRVLGLLDAVIPEGRKNAYWFQKFAQSKLLTDKKRDVLRQELYTQDVPEKSLFLLYDSFINLKGIIADILKTDRIPYITFTNIGQMIGREVRENVFFNPFRHELDPDLDVIENRVVSSAVRDIGDQELRKYASLILLHLFRFLRYLRYADTSVRFNSLNSSLLIILLLRSELAAFMSALDAITRKVSHEAFTLLLRSLAYQVSMETKRVFLQELKEVFKTRHSSSLKGRIENSQGILKNLIEQSIVQTMQFFNPRTTGADIFEAFITKRDQSLKLREDVLVLQRLLLLLEKADSSPRTEHIFDSLQNFMLYFQSVTFKLLRYDDYEEFSSFFSKVGAYSKAAVRGKDFDRLLDRIRQFRVFVETCANQISNRAELAAIPVDMQRVEESLDRYLH